jgi:hypothetical protein
VRWPGGAAEPEAQRAEWGSRPQGAAAPTARQRGASAPTTRELDTPARVLTVNFRQPRVRVIHWFRL